jgi:hypothetical protein
MVRRQIASSALRNAAQRILAAALLAAIGCAKHEQRPPLAGDYPRSRVQLKQGRRMLPVPTEGPLADALPTSMKLDNSMSFAVETDEKRLMSGKYRLERDSIIFDQYKAGEIRRAFAGRAFGDTIEVLWRPPSGDEVVPAGVNVELRFVLKPVRWSKFPKQNP